MQIPRRCKIGYGLYLGHGICMVINPNTIIGNNVNLSHFLNIGSNKKTAATIGDNVWIGPGVCIVEDVHIGNNATVGAGAVVTKDVPEGSTVAGEDTDVLRIPLADIRKIGMTPQQALFESATSVLLDEAYRRYLAFYSKTPSERYRDLIVRCPENIICLPFNELASYLSVSRRQFLRIRETVNRK